MNKKQKTHDDSKPKRGAIDLYAVQCDDCRKWRTIETREEYEKLRSNYDEERFVCNSIKLNTSCDDPPDIDYDTTRTWVIDKPNLPVTPEGFKRELILRPDYSKLDAHYLAPDGKNLRSQKKVLQYLQKHPELSHVKMEDFNFTAPKIIEETIPEDARKLRLKKSPTGNKNDDYPHLASKKKTGKKHME